jgi:TldD protein
MSDALTPSSQHPISFFDERFGLDRAMLERALGRLLGGAPGRAGSIDYADLYAEYRVNESLSLEEGIVKQASHAVSQGAGLRALSADKTGYAYTDEISVDRLALAASQAKAIAQQQGESTATGLLRTGHDGGHDLYSLKQLPTEAKLDGKLELLKKIDQVARAYDPRISSVITSISSEDKLVVVASTDGWVAGDRRPLVRLNVTCIAEEKGRREIGSYGGGGRLEFGWLLEEERFARFAREAARQAILNLSAREAPAGVMTVVLGPGWPGILLHEAIGHGLEADFNRKGVSAFTGKIGQRVASELCTIVDDGTIANRRGSLNIDDEGTPTSRTVLIERGVLKGYLQDRLNAKLMGMAPTGNGRRQSFAHPPMPRMTNTFMLAGQADPAEILRSVKSGLYAVSFGGGQVDITNGKFVFSASEAYLIEDGKVTAPVKGATLIGNGPDVLTRVSMVGNDLKLDEGVGVCGKDGQSVPVGVGLPTIRIDGLTVGGTSV